MEWLQRGAQRTGCQGTAASHSMKCLTSVAFAPASFLSSQNAFPIHSISRQRNKTVLHQGHQRRRFASHKPPSLRMTKQRLSSVEAVEWLKAPVTVSGKVQRGFGRGSRDLGTPTANLPGKLVHGVAGVDRDGVYLGFGRVPKFGNRVVKMVANLGRNITYGDVEERVLEAYLMTDEFDEEFYGEEMRLCVIGFLRPEWKFDSLDELIQHIRNDVAVSEAALNLPEATPFRTHPSLTS